MKLLKEEQSKTGKQYKLIDSTYFSNKEGFGYMLRKLEKGNYQIQVRKYSFGFDVFDFTARIYAKKNIKLIDVEQEEIARHLKQLEEKKNDVGGTRTITESSNPTSKAIAIKKHFTKAGD